MAYERKTRDCGVCGKRREHESFEMRTKDGWVYGRLAHCRDCRLAKNRAKYKANPRKALAHRSVSDAIKAGVIKKRRCQVCKRTRRIQLKFYRTVAHHCDYGKPLEVLWLCDEHHFAWHKLFIAEGA